MQKIEKFKDKVDVFNGILSFGPFVKLADYSFILANQIMKKLELLNNNFKIFSRNELFLFFHNECQDVSDIADAMEIIKEYFETTTHTHLFDKYFILISGEGFAWVLYSINKDF